ncbi:unnamed protein product, partial [Allacma fusca]
MRYVLDLRRFNPNVIKNTYPLPIPQDQFDRLHGARWFISLDAVQEFLQRMLDAKSRLKMAFTTPDGKFCMNRLPFGFRNSPGEFQNMMDDILGTLREIVTDGGSHFAHGEFPLWLKSKGIKHIIVMPNSPQSMGIVERQNKTIKTFIKKCINKEYNKWDSLLPLAVRAHNFHVNEGTNYSPYFLFHGREPLTRLDLITPVLIPHEMNSPEEQAQKVQKATEKAVVLTTQQQKHRDAIFNAKRKEHIYLQGDLVKLKAQDPHQLGPKWLGPYEIVK